MVKRYYANKIWPQKRFFTCKYVRRNKRKILTNWYNQRLRPALETGPWHSPTRKVWTMKTRNTETINHQRQRNQTGLLFQWSSCTVKKSYMVSFKTFILLWHEHWARGTVTSKGASEGYILVSFWNELIPLEDECKSSVYFEWYHETFFFIFILLFFLPIHHSDKDFDFVTDLLFHFDKDPELDKPFDLAAAKIRICVIFNSGRVIRN